LTLETPPTEIEPPPERPVYASRGSPAFLKISAGVFLAGFSAFSLLFCVQPLLPLFAADFSVPPAEAAMALSLTAGVLAVSVVVMAAVAVGLRRRTLMFVSMLAASLLTLVQVFAPGWHALLVLRAVEGVAIAGVPTVVLAYLSEEIEPSGLGYSVGLYVAGNGIGGMMGRLVASAVADAYGWRAAMGMMGAVTLAASAAFIFLMPESRNFTPHRDAGFRYHWNAWASHITQAPMRRLFLLGFIVMGAFVSLYNYAAFRLSAPPYSIGQAHIGMIFLVYLFGVVSSPIAGAASDRLGRPLVLTLGLLIMGLGTAITLAAPLAAVVVGIAVITVGFFVAQPVLSSWPGSVARGAKGHATSLYLLAWYGGAAVAGVAGGQAYSLGGWRGLTIMIFAMLTVGLGALWAPGGALVTRPG
jgi:YNFM family putative membrane transporter